MAKQWKEIEKEKIYGYDEGVISVRLDTPLKTGGHWHVSLSEGGKSLCSVPFMQEAGLEYAIREADRIIEKYWTKWRKER